MQSTFVKAGLALAAGALVLGVGTALAAPAPYPTVVATAIVPPSHTTVIHFQTATVTIPPGTFSSPVIFQVLEGPTQNFSAPVSGQHVIFDFMFQVTTLSHTPVAPTFGKVLFSLNDPAVTPDSQYYNYSLSVDQYTLNPATLMIHGAHLTHEIATDKVGWVITSPDMMTTP